MLNMSKLNGKFDSNNSSFTSSLMMVALLRDLRAEVIFLPKSAKTMVRGQ